MFNSAQVSKDVESTWCLCRVLLWIWTLFRMCVIYCYGEKCIMEHDSFTAVKSTFAIYSAIKDRISS